MIASVDGLCRKQTFLNRFVRPVTIRTRTTDFAPATLPQPECSRGSGSFCLGFQGVRGDPAEIWTIATPAGPGSGACSRRTSRFFKSQRNCCFWHVPLSQSECFPPVDVTDMTCRASSRNRIAGDTRRDGQFPTMLHRGQKMHKKTEAKLEPKATKKVVPMSPARSKKPSAKSDRKLSLPVWDLNQRSAD